MKQGPGPMWPTTGLWLGLSQERNSSYFQKTWLNVCDPFLPAGENMRLVHDGTRPHLQMEVPATYMYIIALCWDSCANVQFVLQ